MPQVRTHRSGASGADLQGRRPSNQLHLHRLRQLLDLSASSRSEATEAQTLLGRVAAPEPVTLALVGPAVTLAIRRRRARCARDRQSEHRLEHALIRALATRALEDSERAGHISLSGLFPSISPFSSAPSLVALRRSSGHGSGICCAKQRISWKVTTADPPIRLIEC